MGTAVASRPLVALPEVSRVPETLKGFDHLALAAAGPFARWLRPARRFLSAASRVAAMERRFAEMTDAALRVAAADSRDAVRRGRVSAVVIETALSVAREAAFRELGQRAFPVQVAGALALHAGCAVEMATGEGKTLTAVLAAALAGWRGRGVHVVTANDYLAARDAAWMTPVYARLGLSVGCVGQEMQEKQRREAYRCDVTYTTNKEVTADYLRDRLRRGTGGKPLVRGAEPLLRPLHPLECAIVDEADFVLIDDAVTPLILSGEEPNAEEASCFVTAHGIAARLVVGEHYTADVRHRECVLTPAGSRMVESLAAPLGGVWAGVRRREELVLQALEARELFHRGREYVVQDRKVQIVDEGTGRIMADRSWQHGVHQSVEVKEGLPPSPTKSVHAKVSFQRLFRMYRHLCGMTGTAHEARQELWSTYRLPVVRIPTNLPGQRERLGMVVTKTEHAKWDAVAEAAGRFSAAGRPVLIGTRSVRESEAVSLVLAGRGVRHEVVNAVRHQREAAVVERAGEAGRVTVATNMAGRGTDIRLSPGALAAGGLVVIATARHESGRIDRQLAGRAARQGEPGAVMEVLSLEDDLLKRHGSWVSRGVARMSVGAAMRMAQSRAERKARRQRRQLLLQDDWLDENLGFARAE
jgi:preprotein translocase subunit SecA